MRHLRAEVDGNAMVVASSTIKQFKVIICYFRRWSRFNNRTERSLGYITRRYAVQTVETSSLPPTAVLVIQDRGIYIHVIYRFSQG